MTIGQRIKARREELGLTQEELAKKVGYASRSSINKIELSRSLPAKKIELMANALDTSPSFLMGWTDNPNSSLHDNGNTISPNGRVKQIRSVDIFEGIPAEEIREAIRMYEAYTKSLPQIQKAVDDLLGTSEPDA